MRRRGDLGVSLHGQPFGVWGLGRMVGARLPLGRAEVGILQCLRRGVSRGVGNMRKVYTDVLTTQIREHP